MECFWKLWKVLYLPNQDLRRFHTPYNILNMREGGEVYRITALGIYGVPTGMMLACILMDGGGWNRISREKRCLLA